MAPVPGGSDLRSVIRHERPVPLSGYAFGQPDLQREMALPPTVSIVVWSPLVE